MTIEKFHGRFTNEANGCTVLINSTIQNIKDYEVLGLYAYLSSKPDDWRIHVKEIMNHGGIGKEKAYKLLNKLMSLHLLTRHEIRENGKFKEYVYMLYLRPNCTTPPFPENPEAVNPIPANQDTYKEKKKQKKEDTTTQQKFSSFSVDADASPLELITIFKESLPDNPNAAISQHNNEVEKEVKRLIKRFKEEWFSIYGKPLTKRGWSMYLEFMKENCPGFCFDLMPRSKRRNGIKNFLNWEILQKTKIGVLS